MSDAMIAAIDEALADYAVSTDAMRWSGPPVRGELLADVEALVACFDEVCRALASVSQAVVDAWSALVDALEPILLPTPPASERERALWARQHRHTGPTVAYRRDGTRSSRLR